MWVMKRLPFTANVKPAGTWERHRRKLAGVRNP